MHLLLLPFLAFALLVNALDYKSSSDFLKSFMTARECFVGGITVSILSFLQFYVMFGESKLARWLWDHTPNLIQNILFMGGCGPCEEVGIFKEREVE